MSVSLSFTVAVYRGFRYSAFTVGVIANIYGRFFRGNAFAVMVRIYLYWFNKLKPKHIYNLRHAHPQNESVTPKKITGILLQLPSGLGSGGLLHFASQQASGSSTSYQAGFQVALQLISVSVGLTVGLSMSLVLVFPIQSRRRKSGIFSL